MSATTRVHSKHEATRGPAWRGTMLIIGLLALPTPVIGLAIAVVMFAITWWQKLEDLPIVPPGRTTILTMAFAYR
jgi:hypothetical protein